MAAQFLSALADHALLIIAFARLQAAGLPGWWAPLLKLGFNGSYVALAPLVGPLADAVPKARLLAWMNGVKMLGALLMMASAHPVWGYALIGLGAAAYAPAKYGLVTELVPPQRLVAANGWIEISVVLAALAGIGCGGWLVSADVTAWVRQHTGVDALLAACAVALLVYLLAAVIQRTVPDTGVRDARPRWRPLALWRHFAAANARLWADRQGGLSLAVTTLFWGVGATLQVAVLRWTQEALGLALAQGAQLQLAVALGVVSGAALAGRLVPLAQAQRVLPLGVVFGLMIAALAQVEQLALAWPLLAFTGAVGGLLVVPMNALLQHRGHTVLSAGRSIAVQGFNENLSVLIMLALYALSWQLPWSISTLLAIFGVGVALAMLVLWRLLRRPARPVAGRSTRRASAPRHR